MPKQGLQPREIFQLEDLVGIEPCLFGSPKRITQLLAPRIYGVREELPRG